MIRVKVTQSCNAHYYWISIYQEEEILMVNYRRNWRQKAAAIRNAKAMAKRIGIKFDPEIIRQKGC